MVKKRKRSQGPQQAKEKQQKTKTLSNKHKTSTNKIQTRKRKPTQKRQSKKQPKTKPVGVKETRKKRAKLIISNRDYFRNQLEHLITTCDCKTSIFKQNDLPLTILRSPAIVKINNLPNDIILVKNNHKEKIETYSNSQEWCSFVEELIYNAFIENRSGYIFQFTSIFQALSTYKSLLLNLVAHSAITFAFGDYDNLWQQTKPSILEPISPNKSNKSNKDNKGNDKTKNETNISTLEEAYKNPTRFILQNSKEKILEITKLNGETKLFQCFKCKSYNVTIKKIFQSAGGDENHNVSFFCKMCKTTQK
jgi:hypothetical protein